MFINLFAKFYNIFIYFEVINFTEDFKLHATDEQRR